MFKKKILFIIIPFGIILVQFIIPFVVFATSIIGFYNQKQSIGANGIKNIPDLYRDSFLAAAASCAVVPASILAAQIEVESKWNPGAKSSAGAEGIAQFLPSTWAVYGVDGDKDGKTDIWNATDAFYGQAKYMCSLYHGTDGLSGDHLTLTLEAYHDGVGAIRSGRISDTAVHYAAKINQLAAIKYTIGDNAPPVSCGNSCPDAVKNAIAMNGQSGWYNRCLAFVEKAWGMSDGVPTAYDEYLRFESQGKIQHSDNITPGAFLFYKTSHVAGHVAIYLGNNQVASTDIKEKGKVSIVDISDLTDGDWHLSYLGWGMPR